MDLASKEAVACETFLSGSSPFSEHFLSYCSSHVKLRILQAPGESYPAQAKSPDLPGGFLGSLLIPS